MPAHRHGHCVELVKSIAWKPTGPSSARSRRSSPSRVRSRSRGSGARRGRWCRRAISAWRGSGRAHRRTEPARRSPRTPPRRRPRPRRDRVHRLHHLDDADLRPRLDAAPDLHERRRPGARAPGRSPDHRRRDLDEPVLASLDDFSLVRAARRASIRRVNRGVSSSNSSYRDSSIEPQDLPDVLGGEVGHRSSAASPAEDRWRRSPRAGRRRSPAAAASRPTRSRRGSAAARAARGRRTTTRCPARRPSCRSTARPSSASRIPPRRLEREPALGRARVDRRRRPSARASTAFSPTSAAHDLARHLRDEERVRRHLAADDRHAEAVARVDRDPRRVAADRVEREHDARHARVDHPLHRDAHPGRRTGVVLPIRHRLGVVVARPAALDRAHDLVAAADPEVGVLHAGEARVGRVLGDRARTDRDRHVVAERRVRGATAAAASPGRPLSGARRLLTSSACAATAKPGRHREPGGEQVAQVRALSADEPDVAERAAPRTGRRNASRSYAGSSRCRCRRRRGRGRRS